jgi:hypothetical protein
LFLFEANTSGAGKTLLADLIALILTGRHMTRTGYYHDPIEMDKQIVATCLAGDLVVLFDNVDNGGSFGNSALDRALTGRTYRGRILGKSEMTPDLDLNSVFFVSGNNIALCGDVVRRIVPCRLESALERPEERIDFTIKDLAAYTIEHRGELVCAALTIMKAFIQAGKPDQGLTPMDFPAWSSLVRNAVKWATGEDPAIGRKDLTESDPDREHCAAFVEGWYEVQQEHQSEGMTSSDMLKFVKGSATGYETICNAMASLWPKTKPGELPSSGSIGMKIQTIRGKVYGDKRFEPNGKFKKVKVWKVHVLSKSDPAGVSSVSIPNRRAENIPGQVSEDKTGTDDGKQTHQTHQDAPLPVEVSGPETLASRFPRPEGLPADSEWTYFDGTGKSKNDPAEVSDDKNPPKLASALKWLAGVVWGKPIPRESLHKMGNTLLLNSPVLDEAASRLGIQRTFEDGIEMWSFPE